MGKAEGREGAHPGSQRVGQAPISTAAVPLCPPRPCSQHSLSIQILQNHMQFRMFKTYDKDMEFFFSYVQTPSPWN